MTQNGSANAARQGGGRKRRRRLHGFMLYVVHVIAFYVCLNNLAPARHFQYLDLYLCIYHTSRALPLYYTCSPACMGGPLNFPRQIFSSEIASCVVNAVTIKYVYHLSMLKHDPVDIVVLYIIFPTTPDLELSLLLKPAGKVTHTQLALIFLMRSKIDLFSVPSTTHVLTWRTT